MNDLTLSLRDGTRIVVPASLGAITTYALLEQETWFEKELRLLPHLLRPGMTAIDIGANLGVYSLAMSRLVGASGRVFAYEPTSTTRALLERSRLENEASNLEISGFAISDGDRTGRIVFDGSSELNHLGTDGDGEEVEITSLDAEAERRGWGDPDFLKVDAEGEEEAIIRGANRLLTESSPIVMMEIRAAEALNTGLVRMMSALGYAPYQLLPGAPLLVPLDSSMVDGFELNFLAMKADRAAELAARGLLVQAPARELGMTETEVAEALTTLRGQPFATAFPAQFADNVRIDPTYLKALAAYDIWRQEAQPLARRWAALRYAMTSLIKLVDNEPTNARLATLARIAFDTGRRSVIAPALQLIFENMKTPPLALGEPFWPPSRRFDTISAANPGMWFLAAAAEQIETNLSHSSAFIPPSETLGWLCRTSFATAEMHRRQYLHALRTGKHMAAPAMLLEDAPDNLNAPLWRDGSIAHLRSTAPQASA